MNLKELIKETLEEHLDKSLIIRGNVNISESLQYHIDNGYSLTNNIYRVYSESYFDLVNEVRILYNEGKIELNEEDQMMVETNLGEKIRINDEYIYLDAPYILEIETEEDILLEAKKAPKGKKLGNSELYTINNTLGYSHFGINLIKKIQL